MRLNYFDSLGNIKFIILNGLFLKSFFSINHFYNFFLFYNSFYRINKSVQKSRSFVNFSTRKLYKQKGSGRARVGSASSSIRRSGSRSFPNQFYLNYSLDFKKKFYKLSYFFIYCNLFFNNCFFLCEDIFFLESKSKILKIFLKSFNFYNHYIIFLILKIEKNFYLSLVNFKNIKLVYFFDFNPINLLKSNKFFIFRSCFNYFFNV